jgi:hypothetical protein
MQDMSYSKPKIASDGEIRMSQKAWAFLSCVVILGVMVLTQGLAFWPPINWVNFGVYFIVALLGSGLKVQLPGITGTMSIGYFFVLIGIVSLSLPETLVVAGAAVLLQYIWRASKRLQLFQALFNLASISVAVTVSYDVFHADYFQHDVTGRLVRPFLLALIYFGANTLLVSAAIALTEGRKLWLVWRHSYWWSFPYYLLGAAGAGLFDIAQHQVGWQTAILLLPLAYVVFRSYPREVDRLAVPDAY